MNKKIKLIGLAYCLVSSYVVYPVQVTQALPALLPIGENPYTKTLNLDADVYIYFANDIYKSLSEKGMQNTMDDMYFQFPEIKTENPKVPVFFRDYIFRLGPEEFKVYKGFKEEGIFKGKEDAEEQQLFSVDPLPLFVDSGNVLYSLSSDSIEKIKQAKREELSPLGRIKRIKQIIAKDVSEEKPAEEKFLEKMGDIEKELQQLLSFVGQAIQERTADKDNVMKELERGLLVINQVVQEVKAE